MNGNSYIVNSSDIGFLIEVECVPAERKVDGSEVLRCSYGPVVLSEEIKSTIEMIVCAGGTKFVCNQTNNDDKILINVINDGLELYRRINGKDILEHTVKYSKENPSLIVDKYTSTRLKLIVNEYVEEEFEVRLKRKAEYSLEFSSKQAREICYLLIVFYTIDEQLKTKRIFNDFNFKNLDSQSRIGVLDFLTQIKNLHEENSLLMKNRRRAEKEIKSLKEYAVELEENFETTMKELNNQPKYPTDSSSQLLEQFQRKLDRQSGELKEALAREMALKDKIAEYQTEIEKLLQVQGMLNEDLEVKKETTKDLKEKVSSKQKIIVKLEEELKLEQENRSNLEEVKINEEGGIKSEWDKLKTTNKNFIHEVTSLKGQLKQVSNLKGELMKELEKTVDKADKMEKRAKEAEENVGKTKSDMEKTINELNEWKERYDRKNEELTDLQERPHGENSNGQVVISREQFEEYDAIMKEKDEQDALIMMLKSKIKAQDIELKGNK